jgi:tetratricopeptide (TPR) repeat protein/DNA-binding XRE family transcriptional regulator
VTEPCAPDFSGLLRQLRAEAGLTQEELAEAAGLSPRTVSDLERGLSRTARQHTAGRLADVLCLTGQARRMFVTVAQGRVLAVAAGSEPTTAVPAARAAAVPRELPGDVAAFTGRAAELAGLDRLLASAGQPGKAPGPVVISAVSGTAGVGKTALAVHWAQRAAGRFPDGQLYVNLRGYDSGQPVPAGIALAGFLRALGIPGPGIPPETDQRAAMYRSLLAGRRMLIVLDNAGTVEQARPLLPGTPGCMVLVTSRDTLAGLIARDGAVRLAVDLLPPADAAGLLRALIGARADADPAAVAELAGLCARLPLALRIAAELAAARRAVPLAELVAELAAARLDSLDGGEDRADVRAVFSWSFRQLPDAVAGAFTLIGLHPGADLDVHAAAALTGASTGQARRVLDRLHRASLVQATAPGRYGMHDLLRAYAREQAAARDTDSSCHRALTRLSGYYLAAAATAMDLVFPSEAHRRPRIAPGAAAVPAMPGQAGARAWLDRERTNLVAVVAHCAGHGWPQHAADLAATLHRYLINGSHLPEADTIYGHALKSARRSSDLAAEASALNSLGGIAVRRGRFRDAAGHYQAALERYRRGGDLAGQAQVLQNLGLTEQYLHNYRSAAGYDRQAMAAFEGAGDRLGVAACLCNLSGAEIELGSLDHVSGHLQLALQVFRDQKDQVREAEALSWTGDLSLRLGQLTQAAASYRQSLAIYRRIDQPVGVADQLGNLGEVSLRQGDYQQAISRLRRTLGLYRRTGHQHGETTKRRLLAQALHAVGQTAAARAELAAALRVAAETGNTYQQACAHHDLAESHYSAGQDERARHHWQQALTLYTQLGATEADYIRSRLNSLDQARPPGGPATG